MAEKRILLNNFHILWYDDNYRKMIITDKAIRLEMEMDKPEKIPTGINDFIYKKPIRCESYFTLDRAIEGDIKSWRKLNLTNLKHWE